MNEENVQTSHSNLPRVSLGIKHRTYSQNLKSGNVIPASLNFRKKFIIEDYTQYSHWSV